MPPLKNTNCKFNVQPCSNKRTTMGLSTSNIRIIISMSVVHCHQYYLYLSFYFYAYLLLLNCHCPGVYAQDTSWHTVLANSNEDPIRRVHYGYFPEASPIRVACARGWFKFMQYEVTCYPQTSGKFISDLFVMYYLTLCHNHIYLTQQYTSH